MSLRKVPTPLLKCLRPNIFMADYGYMNRDDRTGGGRFGRRTQPPSTTYGKVDDRSNQGSNAGRAEIYEERVAMPVVNADSATRRGFIFPEPQQKIDGVVTKIETIVEQAYAPTAAGYAKGFAVNREVIEDYATVDGRQGKQYFPLPDQTSKINEFTSKVQTEVGDSKRGAFPRGIFQQQTPNNLNTNSGTDDTGPKAWSKLTGGGAKDGTNEWNGQATGGVTNSTSASVLSKPPGGATKDIGTSEQSRQTGGGAKDIGTNGWTSPTGGGTSKSSISDGGANGRGKQIGGGNNDAGTNHLRGPGGGIVKDVTTNGWSNPSGSAGAGAGDIGPNGRNGQIGGTTNTIATNERTPTDGINSTGTSTWSRPSVGANNSGTSTLSKDTIGTNNTGNDGRSWAGGGGADTGTNGWGRQIDGTSNAIGPNGRNGLIGGTTNGMATSESRPTEGMNSTRISAWSRPGEGTNNIGTMPIVEADNSSASAWSKPIGGTINTGNAGRSWMSGGTNDTLVNGRIGPNESQLKPSPRITTTTMTPESESRPNRIGWSQLPTYSPTYNQPTSNPISYSAAAVDPMKEPTRVPQVTLAERSRFSPSSVTPPSIALAGRNRFSPSSVTPAKEQKTIDSNEAAIIYNGYSAPPPPRSKVIDSLQAARKYKGVIL